MSIADALVLIVALVHAAFAVVEMLLWKHPRVHVRLDYSEVEAQKVAPIVANAGLYNGFVAAGLIWGLFFQQDGTATKMFFLAFVFVAGIFGAVTLKTWVPLVAQSALGVAAFWAVLKL